MTRLGTGTAVALRTLPFWLPIATAWVRTREREALRLGSALSAQQMTLAKRLSVVHPERIRLLAADRIPLFRTPLLRRAAWFADSAFQNTAGIALQYGIMVREDCWGDLELVVHEMAHVAQYERLGGIKPFLAVYLRECLAFGYPNGPLEQEAIMAAARFRQSSFTS